VANQGHNNHKLNKTNTPQLFLLMHHALLNISNGSCISVTKRFRIVNNNNITRLSAFVKTYL